MLEGCTVADNGQMGVNITGGEGCAVRSSDVIGNGDARGLATPPAPTLPPDLNEGNNPDTIDINDPKFNDLTVVPKIGDTTKTKLNDAGIKTVKQLIGMFMVKETKDNFQAWLEGQGVQGGNNVAGPVAIVINNYCHANNL